MRSLAIKKYCTPQEYEILDLPVPEITSPDDVLVKVHAASINPIDVKLASGVGKMFWPSKFPYSLGYDLSGTVSVVGANVPAHLKPGIEVYSRVPERNRGTVSEYALSSATATAVKPTGISHVEATSIPLAALTALQALDIAETYLRGGLKGKTVYIPGGLSGTGSIAVQLAKNVFEARKVITTLSTSKILKAGSLLGDGVVDQIIDYTVEDATKVITRESVDFMFDPVGQAMKSLPVMKKGGIIVSISTVPHGPGIERKVPHIPVLVRYLLNLVGAALRYWTGRYGVEFRYLSMSESADDLTRLAQWIEQRLVKPVVGRVSRLDDVDQVREGCWEVFNAKGGTGKFVIEIGKH